MVASEDKVVIYVACSKGVGTRVLVGSASLEQFSPMYGYVCANELLLLLSRL